MGIMKCKGRDRIGRRIYTHTYVCLSSRILVLLTLWEKNQFLNCSH